MDTKEFLGVDLGVVNIATTSDGKEYCGAVVRGIRYRHAALRKKLQKKGTNKSAKRLLRKLRRKEQRFTTDVNHCISKQIVSVAKDTERGIAMEDLGGIRERLTVRKAQRRELSSWSFFQLRQFVTYKSVLSGVEIQFVDPRNTSRTCTKCGHIDKKNRKS